jgi:DNA adenine methylase
VILPPVTPSPANLMRDSKSFKAIIEAYDSENKVFYIDPPYVNREHYYKGEFCEQDHIELAKTLYQIKGKAIVSYYHHPLIDNLYKDWNTLEIESIAGSGICKAEMGQTRKREKELLFMNFSTRNTICTHYFKG